MSVVIEVCVDNAESLRTAIHAGAHRIELCSALALGGLTPSDGFIKYAMTEAKLKGRSVYAMIRPRAGDFLFNNDEIDIMVHDIKRAKSLGVQGVVVGALNVDGSINQEALHLFMQAANTNNENRNDIGHLDQRIGVTFHRAFDLCSDPALALEILINSGCERILTSGQQKTADLGVDLIARLIKQANERIIIMPGSGVHANNARDIVNQTGAVELHLSGKTTRKSLMQCHTSVKMGHDDVLDDLIDVASFEKITAVVRAFK